MYKEDGICPICNKHYEFKEMVGDYIVSWSKGRHTEYSNLQGVKSNNLLNN